MCVNEYPARQEHGAQICRHADVQTCSLPCLYMYVCRYGWMDLTCRLQVCAVTVSMHGERRSIAVYHLFFFSHKGTSFRWRQQIISSHFYLVSV